MVIARISALLNFLLAAPSAVAGTLAHFVDVGQRIVRIACVRPKAGPLSIRLESHGLGDAPGKECLFADSYKTLHADRRPRSHGPR